MIFDDFVTTMTSCLNDAAFALIKQRKNLNFAYKTTVTCDLMDVMSWSFDTFRLK